MKDIKILAIESSCDETAAAVVVNGREALSNVISSQIDLHTPVSYTHLRAHETRHDLVCRLLLEKKK